MHSLRKDQVNQDYQSILWQVAKRLEVAVTLLTGQSAKEIKMNTDYDSGQDCLIVLGDLAQAKAVYLSLQLEHDKYTDAAQEEAEAMMSATLRSQPA